MEIEEESRKIELGGEEKKETKEDDRMAILATCEICTQGFLQKWASTVTIYPTPSCAERDYCGTPILICLACLENPIFSRIRTTSIVIDTKKRSLSAPSKQGCNYIFAWMKESKKWLEEEQQEQAKEMDAITTVLVAVSKIQEEWWCKCGSVGAPASLCGCGEYRVLQEHPMSSLSLVSNDTDYTNFEM